MNADHMGPWEEVDADDRITAVGRITSVGVDRLGTAVVVGVGDEREADDADRRKAACAVAERWEWRPGPPPADYTGPVALVWDEMLEATEWPDSCFGPPHGPRPTHWMPLPALPREG